LSGLQLSYFAHDGWRFAWYPILAFYFFAGLVLVGAWVIRTTTGKGGLGALRGLQEGRRGAPGPTHEDKGKQI
jgi:hypothetical protein